MNWSEINRKIDECLRLPDPLYCLLNLFEQTNDGMVAFKIGELYQKLGEIEKAIQYYEIAYELFPKREFKELARRRIESLISSDWITINRKLIPECLQSDNPINCLKRLYEQNWRWNGCIQIRRIARIKR